MWDSQLGCHDKDLSANISVQGVSFHDLMMLNFSAPNTTPKQVQLFYPTSSTFSCEQRTQPAANRIRSLKFNKN
jgi:hypothetical protein